MPTLEEIAKFWSDEGLKHVIPDVGQEFPEGFDVYGILKQLIDPSAGVLEVGCGYGRLSKAFPPDKYIGVDVNAKAIEAARQRNPGYRYELIKPAQELPKAGVALIYTVGLHIPDEELARFLKPICDAAKVVMIAEIMDSRWRRTGNPPVFNHDPEQYILEMANRGFLLRRFGKAVYKRYDTPPWNQGHFDIRMSFHLYAKLSN
jgi:SAM-dependent methyltransferase